MQNRKYAVLLAITGADSMVSICIFLTEGGAENSLDQYIKSGELRAEEGC